MTPLAIAAMLFLPTPWLVALAAVLFLAGLWEWFRLAEIDDTLARTVLLVANLALMVAIVWASRSGAGYSFVLFQLAHGDRRDLVAAGAAVAEALRLRLRPRHARARVQAGRRHAGDRPGLVRAGAGSTAEPARTAIAGC